MLASLAAAVEDHTAVVVPALAMGLSFSRGEALKERAYSVSTTDGPVARQPPTGTERRGESLDWKLGWKRDPLSCPLCAVCARKLRGLSSCARWP